jgi:hypothetical protein
MIASLAQIKSILGYTDTTYDSRITTLLPMIEAEIIEYCNNNFLNVSITFDGDCTITASGGVYKIVCADGGMDDVGFAVSDTVYIAGSNRNDGYVTISAISDGEITIAEPLIAESTAVGISLTLALFPAALTVYLARMIGYQIKHAEDAGISSESIGKYSYSRKDSNGGDMGYPQEILKGLDKWKFVRVGRGQKLEHYNENRGSWIPANITGGNWPPSV